MSDHDGGCLCGAVRYRVTADPQRIVQCHCRFCQRSSGSASVMEGFFPATELTMLTGQPAVYDHRSEGSGQFLHLYFCSRCGTKIYTVMDRYPGMVAVLVGTFDDPEWYEPAQDLRYVFLDSARAGTVIPPNVRTFGGASVALNGQPNTPRVFDHFHIIPSS